MSTSQAFKEAQALFLNGHGRKAVIEFLHEQDITGEEAENIATQAYQSIQGDLDEKAAAEEDKAFGGPWGKMAIGVLALGIVAFGIVKLDRLLPIVLLIGLIFLGDGVWRLVKRSNKNANP